MSEATIDNYLRNPTQLATVRRQDVWTRSNDGSRFVVDDSAEGADGGATSDP